MATLAYQGTVVQVRTKRVVGDGDIADRFLMKFWAIARQRGPVMGTGGMGVVGRPRQRPTCRLGSNDSLTIGQPEGTAAPTGFTSTASGSRPQEDYEASWHVG